MLCQSGSKGKEPNSNQPRVKIAMVGDNLIIESELSIDMLEEKLATPSEVIIFRHGVIITPFVRPWSTTTITESKPPEWGDW